MAAVVVALCAAACGGATTGSSPSLQATAGGHPDPAMTVPPDSTPLIQPSAGTIVAVPADDGARVTAVDAPDARIRDLTIDSPAVGVVTVRLLVPARFDAEPGSRWPVLFLLHGANGSSRDWTNQTDLEALTASSDIVVVMPDAGDVGFYSDWWNDGDGGRPMWETFHLTELPQILERNWRISDRWVIAGLSMGGFGAMSYAARHPGLFLAAASYSGVLDPIGGHLDVGTSELWGDPIQQATIWQEHDPANLAGALAGTVLYVSYGNGQPGPFDHGSVSADDLEPWIATQNDTFVDRLDALHIAVTVDAYGAGSHSWPYWERALHRSLPLLLRAIGA